MVDSVVVASPCTGVCRIDAASGWCEGCLRTIDEIMAWSTLENGARQMIFDALDQRRTEVDAAMNARRPDGSGHELPDAGSQAKVERR